MEPLDHATLQSYLEGFDACIAYSPLTGEPGWKTAPLPERLIENATPLPLAGTTDPFELADRYASEYGTDGVVMLIPGSAFDTTGTRHGRGGGWYDRFLSRTPIGWLRVGVTRAQNFSADILLRNPWDEPMDMVFIEHEKGAWTCYDTRPRRTPS